MRASFIAALVLVTACAPPDPVELGTATEDLVIEPSVEILHPVPDDPAQPYLIALDEDCMLVQLVVIDVDGIELVAPLTPDATETQGHVHVDFGAGDYDAAYTAAHTFSRGPITPDSPYASEGIKSLLVTLQANDHSDLDAFDGWDSLVEYRIDPNGCF